MKTLILAIGMVLMGLSSEAQVKSASLQASGLTCSMCSKAVLNALQKVSFVEKVQVDIKNQQYNMTFKSSEAVNLDALAAAVSDAGFSVASLTVTAELSPATLKKDEHIRIGDQSFHFLNAADQSVNGTVSFTIADKAFTSEKNFKKYSGMSKMSCVKTGKMAACCSKEEVKEETRIYHAII